MPAIARLLVCLALLTASGPHCSLSAGEPAPGGRPRVFLLHPEVLQRTLDAVRSGDDRFREPLRRLRRDAQRALTAGPFSVVHKTRLSPGGSRHDYMSLSRYHWPDPASADGLPYIRRDGETNPEVHEIPDHEELGRMTSAVTTLSYAYYFTAETAYAEKAASLVRAWFLDSATAMTPHLRYAQAVPGVAEGRSWGVLDGRSFAFVLDAIGLLGGSGAWREDDERRMLAWVGAYLDWLLMSEAGRGEAAAPNNHGVWYDVQVAALALHAGRDTTARRILQQSREGRIGAQIMPDGSMPRELARTTSAHYTYFNLTAFCALASLAERVGLDLWRYTPRDGGGIRRSLEFVLPFLRGEKPWDHQQIQPFSKSVYYPVLLQAARQYPDLGLLPLADQIGEEKGRIHVSNLLYGYGR